MAGRSRTLYRRDFLKGRLRWRRRTPGGPFGGGADAIRGHPRSGFELGGQDDQGVGCQRPLPLFPAGDQGSVHRANRHQHHV